MAARRGRPQHRFNLLLLEEGEYFFDNYVGVAYITSSRNPSPASKENSGIDSDDSDYSDHETGKRRKGDGNRADRSHNNRNQQQIMHAQPDVRNGYFGYLKICSRGLYFDPHDPAIPVHRFRYKDMLRKPHVEWNPKGCYSNDLVTTAEGGRDAGPCITFCISTATTMKRNYRVEPYEVETLPESCYQYIAVPFVQSAKEELLPFITQLYDMNASVGRGDPMKEQQLLDEVLKERHRGEFDLMLLQDEDEQPLMSATAPWLVERIEPLVTCNGRLFVSNSAVYFQQVNINNIDSSKSGSIRNKSLSDSKTLKWPLSSISQIFRRRRLLREIGLEITFLGHRNNMGDDQSDSSSEDSDSDNETEQNKESKRRSHSTSKDAAAQVHRGDFSSIGLTTQAQTLGMQTGYAISNKRGQARQTRAPVSSLSSTDVSAAVEEVNGVFLSFSTPSARDEAFTLIHEASNVAKKREAILDQGKQGKGRNSSPAKIKKKLPEFPTTATIDVPPLRRPGVFDEDVIDNIRKAQKAWVEGSLSNYEYLCLLNYSADRTPLDITQYPVFPWIIADYQSEELDLEDPQTFRDLTKPIGALNEKRLSKFRERLEEMPSEDGMDAPFLYGTHYSTPGYVLYYLIRGAPEHQLKLQAGRFDSPDRQFYSIASTWESVTGTGPDVKELTFEFFDTKFQLLTSKSKLKHYGYAVHPSSWLDNPNGVPLGVKSDGQSIDNVKLPPWSKDNPAQFVRLNRAALESEYVTHRLHHWIDLIFGYKQRGEMARRSDNLFHPMTYEGVVDLESETSLERRISLQAQIAEFGQTPRQLFNQAHPYYRGASIPVHVPPKRQMAKQTNEEETHTPEAKARTEGEDESLTSASQDAPASSQKDSLSNPETSVSTAGAMHLKSFSRWWTPVSLCDDENYSSRKGSPKKRGSPSRSKTPIQDDEQKLPPLDLTAKVQETSMPWPKLHTGRLMAITFLKGLQSLRSGIVDRSVACTIGEDGMLYLLDVSSEVTKEYSSPEDSNENMEKNASNLRSVMANEEPDISDLVSEDGEDGPVVSKERLLHAESISDCCLYCEARIPTCRLETLNLLCPPNSQSIRQSLVQQHETIAIGDRNGSLHFFDAVSRRKTNTFSNLHTGRIACIDCAVGSFPVGKSSMPVPLLLATGGADGSLQIWAITRTTSSNGSVEIHDHSMKSKREPFVVLPHAESPITSVAFSPETETPLSTKVSVQSIPALLYGNENRGLPENVDTNGHMGVLGVYGTAKGALVWFDPLRSQDHVVATSTSLAQPVPEGLSVAHGNVGITSIRWTGSNGRVIAASGSGRIGIFSEYGVCSGIVTTGDVPRALDLPQPIGSSKQGSDDQNSSDSCVFDGPMQHSAVCCVGSSSCVRFWDIRNLWSAAVVSRPSSSRKTSKGQSKPFQVLCSSECELYNITCGGLVLDSGEDAGQNGSSNSSQYRLAEQPCENWSTCVALENRNRILAVGTEDGRLCVWFKKFN